MKPDLYRKFNDPTTLVLVLLAIMGLHQTWIYAQQQMGIDYYVTWVVADTIRNDGDYRIYDRQDKKRLAKDYRKKAAAEKKTSRRRQTASVSFPDPTASPFLYATVFLLSNSDYDRSLTIWSALSLIGFTSGILLFCRLLGFSMTASLVIFVPLMFWMTAFESDLRVANVNGIQLGLLGLAYFLLSRDAGTLYPLWAGAFIAMVVALKPNLAPVSLLVLGAWLVRGQRRRFLLGLLGMAAGAVFAFAMSGLIFGDIGIWFEWLDRMFRLTRIDMPASAGNYEIIQPMDRAPGSPGMRLGAKGEFALAMALCGLTLGFLWWGRRRDKTALERAPEAQAERELIEYAQLIGIGCMVQMLVSPLVWLHYHTLAIPMLIVAFRPWSRAPAHRTAGIILQRLLPALVLLAFLNGPHWQLIAGDDVRGVHAKVMAASFIVLYLTGLWQLRFQDGRLPDRT